MASSLAGAAYEGLLGPDGEAGELLKVDDRQIDGWIDRWMDGWMDGWINMYDDV